MDNGKQRKRIQKPISTIKHIATTSVYPAHQSISIIKNFE